MKITQKLIAGYASLALLVIAVGLFALIANKQLVRSYESDEKHFHIIVAAATEVTSYVKRAEGHLIMFLTLHDRQDKEKFFKRYESLQEQIMILDKAIKNPEARTIFDKIKSSAGKVLSMGEALIKTYNADMEKTGSFDPEKHAQLVRKFYDLTSETRRYGVELAIFEAGLDNKVKAAALKKASNLQQDIVLIVVAAIFIALIYAYILARAITKPIIKLKGVAEEIGRGNLDVAIKIESKDEIGTLADSFNKMACDLQTLMREQKKLESQLRHSQKIEAVAKLAGGASHYFDNILTGIMGLGYILKTRLKEDDPLRVYANQILISSERAANLTKNLVVFSRSQIIDPKPVHLNEIAERARQFLTGPMLEGISLEIKLTDKDLPVMADSTLMEQVLINLCINACDAMPAGGVLGIQTDPVELGEKYFKDGKPGMYARISVSDTGTGMDEQTKERMFEPFFTTKEVGKGTGLGLAMVYGIIKQHDGNIDAQSETGKGTTFNIYLPIIEPLP